MEGSQWCMHDEIMAFCAVLRASRSTTHFSGRSHHPFPGEPARFLKFSFQSVAFLH